MSFMESLKENWNGLPKWAKIGIPAAGGLLIVIGLVKGRGQTVAVPTANQVTDGIGGGGKISDQQLAQQTSQSVADLQAQFGSAIASSLTGFQDDLMKQQQANVAALAGFQSQIKGLMGQIAQLKARPDTHQSVADMANASRDFIDRNTLGTGLGDAATIHDDGSVTSNINGTTVAGNYDNVDTHSHVVTAPGIGTFVWNDQSGIALPDGAVVKN